MFRRLISKLYRHKEDITLKEMQEIIKNNKNVILLDVRSNQEYNEGNIAGSINIPVYDIEKQYKSKLQDKETTIIVYCSSGTRSKRAIQILKRLGYKNLYNIEGGIDNL